MALLKPQMFKSLIYDGTSFDMLFKGFVSSSVSHSMSVVQTLKRFYTFMIFTSEIETNICWDFEPLTDLGVLLCSRSAGRLRCCSEADAGGCSGEAGLQDSHLHPD